MPEPIRLQQIRASALWAAYGDAMGFMTELADRSGVTRRGVRFPVEKMQSWKRRVGGRFGPTIELPAGCLSDDTQLRLAVCRAMRNGSDFDVDMFAKVELPIWTAYALGAGRGSQEAANNLRRRNVSWATNFFDTKRSIYIDAGGNGAAMRIQPHAWAAPDESPPERWMTNVVVDSVCTHGHMRGILGAVFHASCVRHALTTGHPPDPGDWLAIAEALNRVPELIVNHEQLNSFWFTLWQRRSGRDLFETATEAVVELRQEIGLCTPDTTSKAGAYRDAVERTEAYRPDQRGSGTKTALLAALAAWLYADAPAGAIEICVNHLGTDTDSISTMAGAIVGAAANDQLPPDPIGDRAYIEREAERMWAISDGRKVPNFPYPSLVSWTPPKTQLDSIGTTEGSVLAVAGLGPAIIEKNPAGKSKDNATNWSWIELWFGQRILAKHRPHPPSLPNSQAMEPMPRYTTASLLDLPQLGAPTRPLRDSIDGDVAARPSQPPRPRRTDTGQRRRTMHQLTDDVIGSGFDPSHVGEALLELADRDDGIERASEYAAIIAKALLSRRDRRNRA